MSAYSNDPRVVRISDSEYWLPDGGTRWRVRFEGGGWQAYDQYDQFCEDASRMATADEAIAALIGEPQ